MEENGRERERKSAAVRTVRLVQMGVKALVPQVNSLFPFTSSTLM